MSKQVLVGGSVGPYGACQCDKSEYHGNYVDKMKLEVYIEFGTAHNFPFKLAWRMNFSAFTAKENSR
jgi:hypothetical protein